MSENEPKPLPTVLKSVPHWAVAMYQLYGSLYYADEHTISRVAKVIADSYDAQWMSPDDEWCNNAEYIGTTPKERISPPAPMPPSPRVIPPAVPPVPPVPPKVIHRRPAPVAPEPATAHWTPEAGNMIEVQRPAYTGYWLADVLIVEGHNIAVRIHQTNELLWVALISCRPYVSPRDAFIAAAKKLNISQMNKDLYGIMFDSGLFELKEKAPERPD